MRYLVIGLLAPVVLSVFAVPATAEDTTPTPTPTPTATTPAPLPVIAVKTRPKIVGKVKYGSTLRRTPGTWSVGGLTVKTRWFKDGRPIKGATKARYTLRPGDVGHRIMVKVRVSRTGYASASATSERTAKVRHKVKARHTVTYRIVTKGKITTSKATFRKQVAETLNDPRGWRSAGIAFREVKKGGQVTIVLSQASKVTSYSSACSTQWSCRVGRYVIINQERWKHASPAWRATKGSIRNYRHMVVNHEMGHWLGWGHSHCGGKGKKAPVMMQQSKGLGGCTFNPWPKSSELKVPRYR